MIRVLIADDHEVVRKGLAMVLRLEPGLVVAGEAVNGAEAVRLARELRPDVVVLDLKMPVLGGDAAARELRAACPTARVLMLSGAEVDEAVLDLVEQVDGYVLKDAGPAELAQAIRSVAAGGRYLHAGVVRAMLGRLSHHPVNAPAVAAPPALSPREREVLGLMATPATYREIGQQLFISEETVRSHAKSILSKLGQPNRTQAVVAAVRLGLLNLD